MEFIHKIKNMFKRGQAKARDSDETINIVEEFHPEILFLINDQYEEYAEYEEL